MIKLGVNIDHVATVRQARRGREPDPVIAAALAEQGGADGITFHLREDRRHIQNRDVELLLQTVTVRTNLEIACAEEVLAMACRLKPDLALLVPEKRQELTTEGGLDVAGDTGRVADAVMRLRDAGVETSLFIDPDPCQIEAAAEMKADAVELHTGPYAEARGKSREQELARLVVASKRVIDCGLTLNAGHGLNYHNVRDVAAIEGMCELNIGHSIVSRAVVVGMKEAVAEMRRILDLY